jgi:hypothetical protein
VEIAGYVKEDLSSLATGLCFVRWVWCDQCVPFAYRLVMCCEHFLLFVVGVFVSLSIGCEWLSICGPDIG